MFPTDITLSGDAVLIDLRGLAMVGAIRRRLEVPFEQIRDVRVDPLERGRPLMWRLGGLAIGPLHFGTFRRGGRWLFLAVTRRDRLVHLVLDGRGPERVRFSEIVLSPADPDALAADLRARIARRR